MTFMTDKDRQYTTPEDICAYVGDGYAPYLTGTGGLMSFTLMGDLAQALEALE